MLFVYRVADDSATVQQCTMCCHNCVVAAVLASETSPIQCTNHYMTQDPPPIPAVGRQQLASNCTASHACHHENGKYQAKGNILPMGLQCRGPQKHKGVHAAFKEGLHCTQQGNLGICVVQQSLQAMHNTTTLVVYCQKYHMFTTFPTGMHMSAKPLHIHSSATPHTLWQQQLCAPP